jgi:hypothetical protein
VESADLTCKPGKNINGATRCALTTAPVVRIWMKRDLLQRQNL